MATIDRSRVTFTENPKELYGRLWTAEVTEFQFTRVYGVTREMAFEKLKRMLPYFISQARAFLNYVEEETASG